MPSVRRARLTDIEALNALIAKSARDLSRGFYTPRQIDSLVTHLFGVDTQLIVDGTYFAIEGKDRLVACGGWSRRRTLFGGDQAKPAVDPLLDPERDAARIRAFFVAPEASRQGLGRMLLQTCERAARDAGFRRAELMSTLPGEPLYRALGYDSLERVTHRLADGVSADFIRMGRRLVEDS